MRLTAIRAELGACPLVHDEALSSLSTVEAALAAAEEVYLTLQETLECAEEVSAYRIEITSPPLQHAVDLLREQLLGLRSGKAGEA